MIVENLKFDGSGLIPAIVQDSRTGRVLTLAYMNRESLDISLREGRTCFYSRSRQMLWRKGETSGNIQRIVSVTPDCDGDALLISVDRSGPACHTGADSCFDADPAPAFSIDALCRLIEDRKARPKEGSYTAYLFEKGLDKILKKVGEEAAEVIVAAKNDDDGELILELADLCYHSLVLMAQRGLTVQDIRDELAGRYAADKKVKQETKQ